MQNYLDTLLAPLARLLVAQGVLFPDLAERLKRHYVTAARIRTAFENKSKVTDSRVSVLTGLQRRDISRLQATETPEPRPNHLARLIALWQTEAAYAGRPLPKTGPAPSFEALARSIRKDVHPRTMLDTLISTGTVRDADGTLHLAQSSYQPLAGSEEQLAYLAENTGDHLSAATENVLQTPAPHFERAVHYTGLSEAAIQTLEAEYRSAQMALFEALSQKAAALKKADPGPHRFRVGGYFYKVKE